MLINIIRIILLLIFIISIFLIICLKPKYDINEYLVCSVGNIISQKFVRKRNDKHFGNAKNFISGFNQLPSSKRFFCITHKKIINYLLRKVENNQIQSLKFYKLPFIFNLGKAEIKMGKEKSDNRFERLYIVTFKTI